MFRYTFYSLYVYCIQIALLLKRRTGVVKVKISEIKVIFLYDSEKISLFHILVD